MKYTYEEQLVHAEAIKKHEMENGNVYEMNVRAKGDGGSVMSTGLSKDPDSLKYIISQLEIHLDGLRKRLSELQTE